MLMDKNPLSTEDCSAVVKAAEKDFLEVMAKLSEDGSDALNPSEKILVVYYLEAILVLVHLQRPGVVENMTVSVTVIFWSCDILVF